MHYNCLIVDDEQMLAENTAEYFNLFDLKTAYVLNEKECTEFLDSNSVDVILLDINLENTSGFDLCKRIRQTFDMPILFISARSSDDDVIAALGIGGDDYIKKPYSLSVLLAKVKVVLKRFTGTKDTASNVFENKGLRIDFENEMVYLNDANIQLKAMEYKLLCCLIQNRGRVIHKEELFETVWGDTITGDGTLNVHIRHLREKIEEDPNEPRRIRTVWGRGYIFEEI